MFTWLCRRPDDSGHERPTGGVGAATGKRRTFGADLRQTSPELHGMYHIWHDSRLAEVQS